MKIPFLNKNFISVSLKYIMLPAAIVVVIVSLFYAKGVVENKESHTSVTYPLELPADSFFEMKNFGEHLVLLTDARIYVYDNGSKGGNENIGEMLYSIQHTYENPAFDGNSKGYVIYEENGTRLGFFNTDGKVFEKSLLSEEGSGSKSSDVKLRYIFATVYPNGDVAAAAADTDGKNTIYIYDKTGNPLYKRVFTGETIISLSSPFYDDVTAAVVVGFENGYAAGRVYFLNTTKKDYYDGIIRKVDLPQDVFPFSAMSNGEELTLLCDDRVISLSFRNENFYIETGFGDKEIISAYLGDAINASSEKFQKNRYVFLEDKATSNSRLSGTVEFLIHNAEKGYFGSVIIPENLKLSSFTADANSLYTLDDGVVWNLKSDFSEPKSIPLPQNFDGVCREIIIVGNYLYMRTDKELYRIKL